MFVEEPIASIIAFVCSTLGCVISLLNIYKHSTSYTQPGKQRAILRILGIVPVYAIGSFLSMVFIEMLYILTRYVIYMRRG